MSVFVLMSVVVIVFPRERACWVSSRRFESIGHFENCAFQNYSLLLLLLTFGNGMGFSMWLAHLVFLFDASTVEELG